MIAVILALALAQPPMDTTYEGDWYVSDDTNNNTGERKVDAFQSVFRPEYVTLRMQCWEMKPAFFVEWTDQTFPDVTVLSIGTVKSEDAPPTQVRYVFEKSTDAAMRGMRATPATSRAIVAAIGEAPLVMVTAHLPGGAKTIEFQVVGTQAAWARVVRHCPPTMMPKPPK